MPFVNAHQFLYLLTFIKCDIWDIINKEADVKRISILAVIFIVSGLTFVQAGSQNYDSENCPAPGTSAGSCLIGGLGGQTYTWSNYCYLNNIIAIGVIDSTGFYIQDQNGCNFVQPPSDSPCRGVFNCAGSPYAADVGSSNE
jgi:hypothetical protein